MRIIVVSDTHMPKRAKELPSVLVRELAQADLIIHAGDWQTMAVYEMLSQYGPVEGVYGNVDNEAIKQQFGEKNASNLLDLTLVLFTDMDKNKRLKNGR